MLILYRVVQKKFMNRSRFKVFKKTSNIFFDGAFLSIYLHLLMKLDLSKLCKKKVMGL